MEASFQHRNHSLWAQLLPLLREVEGARALPIEFHCECSHRHCGERISLTLADYERAHHLATRFVVKPNHTTELAERIIERHLDYWVIEHQTSYDTA